MREIDEGHIALKLTKYDLLQARPNLKEQIRAIDDDTLEQIADISGRMLTDAYMQVLRQMMQMWLQGELPQDGDAEVD